MLKRIALSLLLLAATYAFAAPPPDLSKTIDGIVATALADRQLDGARVGIEIRSLSDGSTWYTRNAHTRFVPASTLKMLTASLALDRLTPDYRFSTRLYIDGVVENGILHGDVIVRGGGDPSLLPDDLRSLVHALAVGDPLRGIAPITVVNGRILLDDTFFPRHGPQLGLGWEQEDLPWYYAAPSSALSCNRNSVTVTACGTTPGSPAEVTITPETGLFTINNKTITSADVVTGSVDVDSKNYRLTVTGCVAPGAELTEQLSIADPERFFEEQLRKAFNVEGISVLENANALLDTDAKPTLIVEHTSAPLKDLVHTMLKESDNHYAEQLRWTLLALLRQDTDLNKRYQAIIRNFADQALLTANELRPVDGSGLSRLNVLSPDNAVALLVYMKASSNYQPFYDALPIAGVDGTLKKRMVDTTAQGNVHAKTGTMRGVCTLAGYIDTMSGEPLAFAVFVNDYQRSAAAARGLQDRIANYLARL